MATSPEPPELLVLSASDIAEMDIDTVRLTEAVAAAFAKAERREAAPAARLDVPMPGGAHFMAKAAILPETGYAAVKWLGIKRGPRPGSQPEFVPMVILNDAWTGMPLAVMDAQRLTAMRTASMTAVAARILARPDSRTVGFIACGAQAHAHLDALAPFFPLKRVLASSRTSASAEYLVARAGVLGMEGKALQDPGAVIAQADIVVTSVPRTDPPVRFLDATLLRKGSFVSMVDLGYSWTEDSLGRFGAHFADWFQPGTREPPDRLAHAGPWSGDLHSLLRDAGRWSGLGGWPRAFIFAGSGIADVAAAALIYERALAHGLGRQRNRSDTG